MPPAPPPRSTWSISSATKSSSASAIIFEAVHYVSQTMGEACCSHHHQPDPHRADAGYRRALWAVLAINALMFVVETGAGLAAGSASLQADALDFLGDAGNYVISLAVVGMVLSYRAIAVLVQGVTMGRFGLRVIGVSA